MSPNWRGNVVAQWSVSPIQVSSMQINQSARVSYDNLRGNIWQDGPI